MNAAGLCRTLNMALGLQLGAEVFADDWEAGEDEDCGSDVDDEPWWSTEDWCEQVAEVERFLEEAELTMVSLNDNRERVFAEAVEA